MSKNVSVNGTTYNGISSVKVPLASGGGYATFAEANYQEKTVTQNGVVTPDSGYSALSRVTVNVSSSGSIQEASGTITLTEDQNYLKVTGLDFTPKAFRIVPVRETVVANSTCGCAYVKGSYVVYRTGSNDTGVNVIAHSPYAVDNPTILDDSETPSGDSKPQLYQTGFSITKAPNNFPFRSGMQFNWYAVG